MSLKFRPTHTHTHSQLSTATHCDLKIHSCKIQHSWATFFQSYKVKSTVSLANSHIKIQYLGRQLFFVMNGPPCLDSLFKTIALLRLARSLGNPAVTFPAFQRWVLCILYNLVNKRSCANKPSGDPENDSEHANEWECFLEVKDVRAWRRAAKREVVIEWTIEWTSKWANVWFIHCVRRQLSKSDDLSCKPLSKTACPNCIPTRFLVLLHKWHVSLCFHAGYITLCFLDGSHCLYVSVNRTTCASGNYSTSTLTNYFMFSHSAQLYVAQSH